MLLLCFRVYSFIFVVFVRVVNMNRYFCSIIVMWRGKKGFEMFICFFCYVFLLNSFVIFFLNLWLVDIEILINEKVLCELCCFLLEMGLKLYVRWNFVFFVWLLYKFVFLWEDGWFGRRSWSFGLRFYVIYVVKFELFCWKWNGLRSL